MNEIEKKSLDAFFESADQVLVLKGEWGVGKTHLWTKYIDDRIKNNNLPHTAYSYVSLFGKTNLSEIKSSIFQSSKPIAKPEAIIAQFNSDAEDNTKIISYLPWNIDSSKKGQLKKGLQWIGKYSRLLPTTEKYSGLIGVIEYGLVKNYIVCLDDLERKGANLSVSEIMGLADELAKTKNCKVIIIFNENSLTIPKDRDDFEAYREKVIDVEIEFRPTHRNNLCCVLSENHPAFRDIENATTHLDLKNIRVIKKIIMLIESLWPQLSRCDKSVITKFINNASVLTRYYYLQDKDLPFSFLKTRLQENIFASYTQKKEDISKEEKAYRALSSKLELSTSPFDEEITNHLKYGYVNTENIKEIINTINRETERRSAAKELNDAWLAFTDSLLDNKNEIVYSIGEMLDKHIGLLNVSDYSSGLSLLSELGIDVSSRIDRYIETNKQDLEKIDCADYFIDRRISYKPLLEKIKLIQPKKAVPTIDEVAMKFASQRGWNPEDIDFLAALTDTDFFEWINSNPENMVTKIRSGLLQLKNIHSSDDEMLEKYTTISANVESALRRCDDGSQLNRMRLRNIYGIDTTDS